MLFSLLLVMQALWGCCLKAAREPSQEGVVSVFICTQMGPRMTMEDILNYSGSSPESNPTDGSGLFPGLEWRRGVG